MTLILTSPAFLQGGNIPKKYTCDGENTSPPLQWTGVPDGTQSFLLVCDDPGAPIGIFRHWAAFDIPVDWQGLTEGHGAETLANGFKQAINDFNKPGYGGPCPLPGSGPHHYHFRLSALDEQELPVGSSAPCIEVIEVAKPYIIEFVELIGIYEH